MRLLVGSLAAAVFMVLAGVSSAHAQRAPAGCNICVSCPYTIPDCEPPQICNRVGHYSSGGPTWPGWQGEDDECHEGMCSDDHMQCGAGFALLSPERQDELQGLVHLASMGDVDAVAAIMEGFAQLATIRTSDNSLLIASVCADEPGVYRLAVALSDEQYAIATEG